MVSAKRQTGAGGTSSKYKIAPEEAASARSASSRPMSSRSAVAPEPASASGVEMQPRSARSSGRREAWSVRSATALASPEVKEDLDGFKNNLTGLHAYLQQKIASEVDAPTWALIKSMLPKGAVVDKPEVETFHQMIQELMQPQKKHQRDTVYAAIKRYGTKHGLDTKKGRLDTLRALLNRRDDRVQHLQLLRETQFEDLDEEAQEYYDDIDEYIAYESQTTLKSIPWITKILANPVLAVMAKAVIQAELADLYTHATKYFQGDYYRSYDLRPFALFAYHLNSMIHSVKKYSNLSETEQTYLAFLEDLYRDLAVRLDAAWDSLDAYFKAPWSHPNPRARTHYIHEKLLASFSIYMGLTPEKDALFKSFIQTYFLHSPTTMPRVYKVLIHMYNDTYSASMRDFAFDVLYRMVKMAETKLPETSIHLRVFTIIRPFKGFTDEYYGTKYEDGDRHGKHYTRNFIEILQLLKASLHIDTKETSPGRKVVIKGLLDEKIAWFYKHYRLYLDLRRG